MKIKDAYKIVTLDNGLNLILYPIKEIQSVNIACAVKSGNYYAKDEKNLGIAHFLEHLAFLSTEKFKTAQHLFKRLYEIGGSANALTSLARTLFWIKVPYINTDEALELLYQIVYKSAFTKEDFEKERKVITNECNDNYANPNWLFNRKIQQNRFRNLPQYQSPVIGDINQIRSIQITNIIKWREEFLNPNNMIISAVGNFDERRLIDYINKTFGKEKRGKKVDFPKYKKEKYSKFLVYVQKNDKKQINFDINYPAFGWLEVERHSEIVLGILSHILGRGPISRLNIALRESKGLVYDCGSYTVLFPYLGYVGIWGSTNQDDMRTVFQKIKTIICDLVENGVKKTEFSRIKKYLDLSQYMSFETPESISDYLITELMDYGQIWDPEDYLKERSKVRIQEVGQMAQKIFRPENLNVNFLGNISQKEADRLAEILV